MATVVKDDLKAPFSIATTLRCRGGRYSIPWFAPFYPWSVSFNAEYYARQHQVPFLKSSVWLDLEIEPRFPGPLAKLYPIIHPFFRYFRFFKIVRMIWKHEELFSLPVKKYFCSFLIRSHPDRGSSFVKLKLFIITFPVWTRFVLLLVTKMRVYVIIFLTTSCGSGPK